MQDNGHPISNRTPHWRVFAAAVLLLMLFATLGAPAAASAIPPSPHLLGLMATNAALRRSVNAQQARAYSHGIDIPPIRTFGPRGRVVPNSAGLPILGLAAMAPALRAAAAAQRPFHMLVLLVDFNDAQHQVAASSFDRLMYNDVTGPASVRGYYKEVSAGGIDIQPVATEEPSAIGWLRMPQPYSSYVGTDSAMGGYPNNSQKLLEDACAAAFVRGVDFSNYDSDGDGVLDGVVVIHAGQGAEFTGSSSHIWSHEWYAHSPAPTYNGVTLGSYSTEPEYWQTPGDMTTGVYCHEIGHMLGTVDMYDTTYNSEGLGNWSIMASGSWNGPHGLGDSPARFDAWSLMKLGFDSAKSVTQPASAEKIASASATREGTILRVEKNAGTSGPEYVLVENRQLTGTDSYLPGAGLLIYHVDEGQANNDTASHYMVGLEEAHGGVQNLHLGNSNLGDDGDPFPGTSNNASFNDSTDPSATYFTGPSNLAIRSIGSSGVTMTATVITNTGLLTADLTPPVTTSNRIATYEGTATISLTATDTGIGVESTHWLLDGAPGNGTAVVEPAYGYHTLAYWSTDFSGNAEATVVVSFLVHDIDAPSATCDAHPSYVQSATLTLTATDTATGSGVASISYQLDGAATQTVPSAETTVGVPMSGSPRHLVYWATDAVGNSGAHRAATFTVYANTKMAAAATPVIFAGSTAHVTGSINLASALVLPVTGQHLRLQRLSGASWVWAGVTDALATSGGAFTFPVKPTLNTTYRAIVAPGSGLLPGTSNAATVRVRAVLATPKVPSYVYASRYFSAMGSTSAHVTFVMVSWYHVSSSGKLSAYGPAKRVSVSVGRWSLRKKLARGRWAVRAVHSDADHAWSASAFRTFRAH